MFGWSSCRSPDAGADARRQPEEELRGLRPPQNVALATSPLTFRVVSRFPSGSSLGDRSRALCFRSAELKLSPY